MSGLYVLDLMTWEFGTRSVRLELGISHPCKHIFDCGMEHILSHILEASEEMVRWEKMICKIVSIVVDTCIAINIKST